jgi:membrane protease subunit HflK
MTEHNIEEHEHSGPASAEGVGSQRLDAAAKHLSEALRISFITLKIIMIVLVVVFLASGFRTVGPDERALVLRFGKIRGVGDKRLLGPGPHWVFPYPMEEMVKIPVGKKVNLPINSFWYFQRPEELVPINTGPIRFGKTLDPVKDGYCITRGEKQEGMAGAGASDYNIVHTKWQVIYQIGSAEQFFRNVYVGRVRPGQAYFEVMAESVRPLLQNMVADAVVTSMVNYTIDDAISSQDRIRRHVQRLVQKKLDELGSGIEIVSMQLIKSEWPRQVDKAFEDFIRASQSSQTAISKARTYADTVLSETAGPVVNELFEVLKGKHVSEAEEQRLWNNVAGAARETIANARAYRTEVVETAKANADYLQQILPEFRKRPDLVVQRIWLDAVEDVLNNADEKFVIQGGRGAKGKEIRVMVNRAQSGKAGREQK